jgi:predicted nicotinamide N-methyase
MAKPPSHDEIFTDYCELQSDGGIRYHTLIRDKRDELKARLGLPKFDLLSDPMWRSWTQPWAPAMHAARFITENPEKFQGLCVADLGAGAGLIALAAAKIGAKAIAIDIQPLAAEAVRRNAAVNDLDVKVIEGSVFDEAHTKDANVLFAADLQFYKYKDAGALALLELAAGKEIYMGSSDFSYRFEDLGDVQRVELGMHPLWDSHCRYVYRDARAHRPAPPYARKMLLSAPLLVAG